MGFLSSRVYDPAETLKKRFRSHLVARRSHDWGLFKAHYELRVQSMSTPNPSLAWVTTSAVQGIGATGISNWKLTGVSVRLGCTSG